MGNSQTQQTQSSTILTEQQLATLQRISKLKQEDIINMHTCFINECPSGRIDKKKFIEAYQKKYPNGIVEKYCEFAFARFDTDNDGTIDFNEFLLATAATSLGSIEDRLSFTFDMYDTSGDGSINQKELVNMITAIYDLIGENCRTGQRDPTTRAAEIIKKLDISGDRKLDKKEFIEGCKNDPVIRSMLAPNNT